MKKKIIVSVFVILLVIVVFAVYEKFHNPNPSEEEILKGVEVKDQIRSELQNVINGKENPEEDYQISISEAREKAIIIFNSLGENNLNKDNVKVREIEREGKKYYYISSLENSAEVEINTGRVTRINNVIQ